MSRGIVVEIRKRSVIVMTPEGAFQEIHQRKSGNCLIGEEIWFAEPSRRKFSSLSLFSSVAATIAFVLVFTTLFSVLGSREVVAYISIDFNPSIELGIDKMEKVRSLIGLNMEGMNLVEGIQYKGRSLEEVTAALLRRIETGFLQNETTDIIIASTMIARSAAMDDSTLSQEVKRIIADQVVQDYPQYKDTLLVTAFAAPKEVRDAAAGEGLSAGKYAVYLNARINGHFLQIDDMKENSIHSIAEEAGGLEQLISPGDWSKDTMRNWLEEEISGNLDQKLEQLRYMQDTIETEEQKELQDIQTLHHYAPSLNRKDQDTTADSLVAASGEVVLSASALSKKTGGNESHRESSHDRGQNDGQSAAADLDHEGRQQWLKDQEKQQKELAKQEQKQLKEQEKQLKELAKQQERQKEMEGQLKEQEKGEQERQREMAEQEQERQREMAEQEQERQKELAKQEQERQKELAKQEQERLKEQAKQEQERLKEQAKQEQERLKEQAKQEQERLKEKVKQEREHLKDKANQQKEKIQQDLERWKDREKPEYENQKDSKKDKAEIEKNEEDEKKDREDHHKDKPEHNHCQECHKDKEHEHKHNYRHWDDLSLNPA